MFLADLLADGDDDPLPAEHRAEPEAQRHAPLHPFRDVFNRLGELASEALEDLPPVFRDLVAELPHERPHRGAELDKLRAESPAIVAREFLEIAATFEGRDHRGCQGDRIEGSEDDVALRIGIEEVVERRVLEGGLGGGDDVGA